MSSRVFNVLAMPAGKRPKWNAGIDYIHQHPELAQDQDITNLLKAAGHLTAADRPDEVIHLLVDLVNSAKEHWKEAFVTEFGGYTLFITLTHDPNGNLHTYLDDLSVAPEILTAIGFTWPGRVDGSEGDPRLTWSFSPDSVRKWASQIGGQDLLDMVDDLTDEDLAHSALSTLPNYGQTLSDILQEIVTEAYHA